MSSLLQEDYTVAENQLPERGYNYTGDLLALESCTSVTPCSLPAVARQITTPLKRERWRERLRHHPDQLFAQYLINGISNGFRLGYCREHRCKQATGNMISAIKNPQPVAEFLSTELKAGRIIGPLEKPPDMQISRFGVIPKQNQPGKWRLILDLSSPSTYSVNDGIDKSWCSMRYASVDDAVNRILATGPGTLLAKMDIEHAYRNIPIHPSDRHLLGMEWEGSCFIDTVLPFG